jgi:hypothetical protein
MSEATTQDVIPSLLTPIQEKAVALIYNDVKDIISAIKDIENVNIIVTVSKIIGEVITLVEAVSASKVALSGVDKKMVVIEVIRKIFNDVIKDEEVRAKILSVFDEIAGSTIDIMITVSRGLQSVKKLKEEVVDKVTTVCCPFLSKN